MGNRQLAVSIYDISGKNIGYTIVYLSNIVNGKWQKEMAKKELDFMEGTFPN